MSFRFQGTAVRTTDSTPMTTVAVFSSLRLARTHDAQHAQTAEVVWRITSNSMRPWNFNPGSVKSPCPPIASDTCSSISEWDRMHDHHTLDLYSAKLQIPLPFSGNVGAAQAVYHSCSLRGSLDWGQGRHFGAKQSLFHRIGWNAEEIKRFKVPFG